jgi:hypothetical protein
MYFHMDGSFLDPGWLDLGGLDPGSRQDIPAVAAVQDALQKRGPVVQMSASEDLPTTRFGLAAGAPKEELV